MKTILFGTLFILIANLSSFAQEGKTILQSKTIVVNRYNEGETQNLSSPLVVTINYDNNTVTIESTSNEVTKLFKGQMVRQLEKTMGEIGIKYSLDLDDNIMMHVHVDTKQVLFTRSDIHPKEWGLQLKNVEEVEEESAE